MNDRTDTSDCDETEPRTSALIVRVWDDGAAEDDPHDLRARLLTVDSGGPPRVWTTASGEEAIDGEVRRWLQQVRAQWRALRPQAGASSARGPRAQGPRRSSSAAEPLVQADWLEEHLTDPGLVVVEVDDDARRYLDGHLPGAVQMHWLRDLRHPTRRALADAAAFAALLDGCGIGPDTRVVLYSGRANTLAATAYWTFRHHGHDQVSLLDGGRDAWLAEGRPVSSTPTLRSARRGHPGPAALSARDDLVVGRAELLSHFAGGPALTVVDCRSLPEFTGEPEGLDGLEGDIATSGNGVTGHIPGARSLPVTDLLDEQNRLLPRRALLEICHRHQLRADDRIAVYCSTTDRSALVWFVLHELLGWPDVRCYLGSWAEYGSLVDVPVERGLPRPVGAAPS